MGEGRSEEGRVYIPCKMKYQSLKHHMVEIRQSANELVKCFQPLISFTQVYSEEIDKTAPLPLLSSHRLTHSSDKLHIQLPCEQGLWQLPEEGANCRSNSMNTVAFQTCMLWICKQMKRHCQEHMYHKLMCMCSLLVEFW